jgi:hypothetical protein
MEDGVAYFFKTGKASKNEIGVAVGCLMCSIINRMGSISMGSAVNWPSPTFSLSTFLGLCI